MKACATDEMSSPSDGAWGPAFDWNQVPGRRILVLGIGGGCDIVSAYALSTLVPRTGSRKVYIGNTKGSKRFKAGLEKISGHIYKLPPEGTRIAAQEVGFQFGTAKIDLKIPRGDDGITYMVQAPKKHDETKEVVDELKALGLDSILAVDTGGDVLKSVGRKPGRDQRMWRIIRETGIPALLLVVAPGVDGETSHAEMTRMIAARIADGTCLGVVELKPLIPMLERFKTFYGKNRTPNLILRAWNGDLSGTRPGWVTIPRHENPAYPREWMKWAIAFNS